MGYVSVKEGAPGVVSIAKHVNTVLQYFYANAVWFKIYPTNMKIPSLLLLVFSAVSLTSCTADDDADKSNTVTMTVNGVSRTFEPLSVETKLQQNGSYQLTIWMYANDGGTDESAKLIATYGETGNGGFKGFYTTLSPVGIDDNATEGTFTSNISMNSRTEFEATFSGTLQGGNADVVITNGHIHYLYDDPLGI
ncbi:hypothetical protein HYN48_09895 [Flavobacterium magnum]|uniref:Uncharacterized protein n=2 Tax=Flavobacterium magnum TaxID=2162713 RepID=A0A2S0RFH5_9FLAO|nr:hypothetical protein HYN48_09895 [Flavobacterium magnum]